MHVHEFSPQLPVNNQKYSKTPRRLSKDVCLRGPCYSPEYEQAQHHRQNFNDDDRLSALKCVGTCMQVLLNIIGVSSWLEFLEMLLWVERCAAYDRH